MGALSPRKATKVVASLCGVCAVLLLYVVWPRGRTGQTSPYPIGSEADVLWLLQQEVADVPAWQSRNAGRHFPSVPYSITEKWNPVSFAREQLISRGSTIIPHLLRIIEDGGQPVSIRQEATEVISYFDDPLILVNSEVNTDSPVPWSPPSRARLFVRRSSDERLAALDKLILNDMSRPDFVAGTDFLLLRWLNRIFDQDLDVWLAMKAPLALDFRKEQFAKGYDPAIAFDRLAFAPPDGIGSVFVSDRDRMACRQLLDAVYLNEFAAKGSIFQPAYSSGWEERLRSWYMANRESLEYDIDLHRFLPRSGASSSAATEEEAKKGRKAGQSN